MSIQGEFLGALAEIWPSPTRRQTDRLGAKPATEEWERAYTIEQFMHRVWFGSGLERDLPPLWGKDVLEIGCGHGGITCWLASLGARRAVGVDLNTKHFGYGRWLAEDIRVRTGSSDPLPVEFLEMDCAELRFPEGSFDVVFADNLFEHVTDPDGVLRQVHRVLRPGGRLLVPTFSSILSKYGLHLKHGLKVPWANLLFSEETIVEALKSRARRRPELFQIYSGLAHDPKRVRDVRTHRDLNEITHKAFLDMAAGTGFKVLSFRVHGTRLGRVVAKLAPSLERTVFLDILSTGAGAALERI